MTVVSEHEVFSDGERRVIVRQRLVSEVVRSNGYAQLYVRLYPLAVRIESAGEAVTIDVSGESDVP